MTRAQARIVADAVAGFLAGRRVRGVDGLDGDLAQFTLDTPVGPLAVQVRLPNAFPVANLIPVVVAAQDAIRTALRPFEGDCGRGFNGRRGKLDVGSAGYSANEGWV